MRKNEFNEQLNNFGTNDHEKKVELLAPAGTKEAFIAAVEAGADAIYCGGTGFNARMNAGNFSDEEMAEAIAFAHKRMVKVYVTVNTLLRDEELVAALEYCEKLYAMGADALIIQDLGLGYLVNKYLPDMELHLSTQGTVYDLEGVRAAAKLGYSRVVLARELSLKEIARITAGTKMEVEAFCHGAICMCYSGQCQLSRYIGGRSGNRGGCAQPCRLPYKSDGVKGVEGYPLSPSDLSMIDHIGELIDAGVASLKIEGRMKSPEYVAVVTSIYRKYIDEYLDKGEYQVSPEDRLALLQIFNRGFTTHHLRGNEDEDFLSGDLPKNRGVLMGEVINPLPGGGQKIGHRESQNANRRRLIDIRLHRPGDCEDSFHLDMGDIIEIRRRAEGPSGDASSSIVNAKVTYIEDMGNGISRIGDIKGSVKNGDQVYRITSSDQFKTAAAYYKDKDWHRGRFNRKLPIEIDVWAENGNININGKVDGGDIYIAVCDGPFPNGDGDIGERIRSAMSKTGDTPFLIDRLDIIGEIKLRVPMAKLNSMRRELFDKLERAMEGRRKLPELDNMEVDDTRAASDKEADVEDESFLELYFYSADDYRSYPNLPELKKRCRDNGINLRVLLPLEDVQASCDLRKGAIEDGNADANADGDSDIEIIPYVDAVTAADPFCNILTAHGDEPASNKGEGAPICTEPPAGRRLYIGNLGWIDKALDMGFTPLYDYGMNVYNSAAAIALSELGVRGGMPSLEEDGIYYGAIPLMLMEHVPDEDLLIDRKGSRYMILKRGEAHKTVMVSCNDMAYDTDYDDIIKNTAKKAARIFVKPRKGEEI